MVAIIAGNRRKQHTATKKDDLRFKSHYTLDQDFLEAISHRKLKIVVINFHHTFKFISLWLPNMSISFYGSLTKSLFNVWNYRANQENKLSENALPYALHDMELFPSASQVHEMLHCASECSKRKDKEYITFGEFCVFASELRSCYDKKLPKPTPLSRCSRKDIRRPHSRLKTMNSSNKSSPKYEVFLGGSCNPTTWRRDKAIPFFKSKSISSYNPQVAQWGPELIELENQAKQNADVMFFVIDNQTRSVASMIEAAHIAGTRRKLILVVHSFENTDAIIFGEAITEKELKDLQQGQRYLRDLVERENIPVFNNIPDALKATARVVKEGIKPQDLTSEDSLRPVKMAHVQLAEKLFKLREVFDDLDVQNTGYISLDDVCMAYRILTSQELTVDHFKAVVDTTQQASELKVNLDSVQVNFDQFCCIMTEFTVAESEGNFLTSLACKFLQVLTSVAYPFSKIVDWFLQPRCDDSPYCDAPPPLVNFTCKYRNIYLGGSRKPSSWREDVAIPILKKKGLTAYSPLESSLSEHLSPLEVATIDRCKVLLFVITADSRALSEMILAVHYIGKECNVILCIQEIPHGITIDGAILSDQGVKDYNRGRVYLSDIATRNNVPVFTDIAEAVELAAAKAMSD